MTGPFKILLTGADGFTGKYLRKELSEHGYNCIGLKSDLLDKDKILSEVLSINPHYVIHLAAVSFTAERDVCKIYNVNVVGSTNLLDALAKLKHPPLRVILASTAAVYGNCGEENQGERITPRPISHYACSKLSMEYISQNYTESFPISITRPFNYTGRGHSENFLIPKIVRAYQSGNEQIELGNLDVSREFNDVRDVCAIYRMIMTAESIPDVINICSGQSISLLKIIEYMNELTGAKMNVRENPLFVRANEIKNLAGDPSNIFALTRYKARFSIQETLSWMYSSPN
jgi:nucleoside-diphosphate-sugar epimerase